MPGPATKCFSLIRGRVLRVTKLDGCGNVVNGGLSSIVSDGFITAGFTAQTDTGTTISVTNAAGVVCILDEPAPKFTGYNVDIAFCGVNPALINLLTGQDFVVGWDGTIVGFDMDTTVDADDSGFALELWSGTPTNNCEVGVVAQYGYMVAPFLKGGVLGDFTVANDAINFTMTGARTKDGNSWEEGPYDVIDTDGDGTAGPLLVALTPTKHLHVEITPIAPPAADCDPVGVGTKATGATAGTPGTWTGGYARWSVTDVAGLTATPSTAWSAGQYVVTESGEHISWNATAWIHHV